MKRGWLPLVLMTALIVALGAYTAAHQSAFLSKENLNSLLLEALPLILVSLGQAVALLVGGFDVSVAALMTMVRRRRLVHDAGHDHGHRCWCRACSRSSASGSRPVSSTRS